MPERKKKNKSLKDEDFIISDNEIEEDMEYEEDVEHEEDEEEEEEDEEEVENIEESDDEDELINNNLELLVVKPENHISSNIMTSYEFARVLGDRARHIENGAPPYIDTKNMTSSIEIAYNEILQKKNPMTIIRKIGNNKVEWRNVIDLLPPQLPPKHWLIPEY